MARVIQVIQSQQNMDESTGMSLREIADRLNSAGYQTARKGKWHANSVKRILEREEREEARMVDIVPLAPQPIQSRFLSIEDSYIGILKRTYRGDLTGGGHVFNPIVKNGYWPTESFYKLFIQFGNLLNFTGSRAPGHMGNVNQDRTLGGQGRMAENTGEAVNSVGHISITEANDGQDISLWIVKEFK